MAACLEPFFKHSKSIIDKAFVLALIWQPKELSWNMHKNWVRLSTPNLRSKHDHCYLVVPEKIVREL